MYKNNKAHINKKPNKDFQNMHLYKKTESKGKPTTLKAYKNMVKF